MPGKPMPTVPLRGEDGIHFITIRMAATTGDRNEDALCKGPKDAITRRISGLLVIFFPELFSMNKLICIQLSGINPEIYLRIANIDRYIGSGCNTCNSLSYNRLLQVIEMPKPGEENHAHIMAPSNREDRFDPVATTKEDGYRWPARVTLQEISGIVEAIHRIIKDSRIIGSDDMEKKDVTVETESPDEGEDLIGYCRELNGNKDTGEEAGTIIMHTTPDISHDQEIPAHMEEEIIGYRSEEVLLNFPPPSCPDDNGVNPLLLGNVSDRVCYLPLTPRHYSVSDAYIGGSKAPASFLKFLSDSGRYLLFRDVEEEDIINTRNLRSHPETGICILR